MLDVRAFSVYVQKIMIVMNGLLIAHYLLILLRDSIRLSYGRNPLKFSCDTFKSRQLKLKTEEIDLKLREEWNICCKHMRD